MPTIETSIAKLANAINNLIVRHDNITGSSSQKGHVQAGGVPQSIGTSLNAGTDNGYYARADHVHTVNTSNITDSHAYNNIGTNQNVSQQAINSAINQKIGEAITYINQ